MISHARVADVGQLVAVVPYLLGFHPHRSVVCVTHSNGALGPVQRIDLPDDGRGVPPDVLARVAAGLTGDGVILLGWEDAPGESLAALASHVQMCVVRDVAVAAVAVVRGGRWFRVDAGDIGPGVAVPDPADVPAVAEFVGRGMHPVSSRSDLEEALFADVGDHRAVTRCLRRRRRTDARRHRERDGLAAWARVLAPQGVSGAPSGPERHRLDLSADGVAAAVDALDDLRMRDAIAVRLAPGVVPDDVVDAGVRARLEAAVVGGTRVGARTVQDADLSARLAELAGRVPGEERAGVLSLVALHSWWLGDGARAEIAARRARSADPTHSLAALVAALVDSGASARRILHTPQGIDRRPA